MTRIGLLLLILLPAGWVANGSTCARQCGGPSEENIEWMADGISWRNTLLEWKRLVEEECESIEVDGWYMLFKCPDFSGIRCINDSARRYETDLSGCAFVYCEDGRYQDQRALRTLWKELSQSYREIMEVYKETLKYCPRKECKEATTTTGESSVTTAGDQTTSATDGNTLAATTSAQEYVATTTQVPEEPGSPTTESIFHTEHDSTVAHTTTVHTASRDGIVTTQTESFTTEDMASTSTAPLTTSSGCHSTKFEFSEAEHLDYVQYNSTLPEMAEFTMCFWITPYQGNDLLGTFVSYCVTGAGGCNTIYVAFTSSDIEVYVDGSTYTFSRSTGITDRSLICFVLVSETNKIHYYLNETESQEAIDTSSSVFPQGGVLILGQDQDGAISGNAPGLPHDEGHAFQGIVDGFAIWDKSLTAEEVTDIYQSGCNCAEDAIVVFNSTNSVAKGHVTASWDVACP